MLSGELTAALSKLFTSRLWASTNPNDAAQVCAHYLWSKGLLPTPEAVADETPRVRTRLLRDAEATINGPRAQDYGDAVESFQRLATLWGALLDRPETTPAEVAMCLAALKLSRLAVTPDHRDSWLDLAGYAALGAEVSGVVPGE